MEERVSKTKVCSILTVDIGSCKTKAALFDRVDGRQRFVARSETLTTVHWPVEDISVGVRRAIQKIERTSGRTIMSEDAPVVPERFDGTGVDFFVATTSVGGGLRLLVIASSNNFAHFQQLQHAADLSGVEIEVVTLDKTDGAFEARQANLARTLAYLRPHAIFVVAQSDSKASLAGLGQDIAEAIAQSGCERLPVRFFGDSEAAGIFAQGVPDSLDSRELPSHDVTRDGLAVLQRELTDLWQQEVLGRIPGYSMVLSWQKASVHHSSFAYGDALRFLSRHWKTSVAGIDIGSSTVALFKIVGESAMARVSSKYGVGRGAISLLNPAQATEATARESRELAPAEAPSLRRWLPVKIDADEIDALVLNKWVRPWTAPETEREALFERALGVESIRQLRSEAQDDLQFFRYQERPGVVMGTGSTIVGQANLGIKVLTLLDALEPAGVFEIIVDRDGVLAQLGALGSTWPQAAAEILLGEGLLDLGLCIAGVGTASAGAKAVTLEVRRGGSSEKFQVNWGEIHAIPLDAGKIADVFVKPQGALDFGWGKGKGGKVNVRGGPLGFIVDARGRPLFKAGSKPASEQVSRWLQSLDKQGVT